MAAPGAEKVVVLTGHIFLDANGTGDPKGQDSLEGVRVVALGKDVVTGPDGKFELEVPEKTDQVTLELQPSAKGLPLMDDIVVPLGFCAAGKIIKIPYRALGKLLINATVEVGGNRESLAGAIFSIYKGLVKRDTPVKQITLTAEDGDTLELEEGQYTVALTGFAPPDLQQKYDLLEPPSGVMGACITSGQRAVIKFEFAEKAVGEAPPPEIHKIYGKVTLDNAPVPGLSIRIEDKTGRVVGQAITKKDGSYEYSVDLPGEYFVVALGKLDRTLERQPAVVQSEEQVNLTLARSAQRFLSWEIGQSDPDPTAYPVLTEEVGWPPSPLATPSAQAGATPSAAPIGQAAAKAVSDVLGWKLNSDDPKGFMGALTQSFDLTDVEGHIESTWKPRTYAVQTDLGGGITGAQASLYSRAKDALDQSLPLLDGLYPLDPEADPEDVKALREMARSQMTELVQELGAVGGPSVSKVDTYFKILLGTATTPPTDADALIDSTLKSIRDIYGIYFKNNPFSNSIEDEQDITNFRIISDYMTSLLQTWISNKAYFTGHAPQAFLGTQLVLISRQLSVVAETVNELRFVLDSVFIGPSERQTLPIHLPDKSIMFLEDILKQIDSFVGDEAPRLLRDGGRLAVKTNVLPVTEMLESFVKSAREEKTDVPDGYHTVRVHNSFDDLLKQLKELRKLAKPVSRTLPPPEITPLAPLTVVSVSPNANNDVTGPFTVMVLGTGFQNQAKCEFSPSTGNAASAISVQSTQMISNNLLLVQLNIDNTNPGWYDVTAANPDGAQPVKLHQAFQLTSD